MTTPAESQRSAVGGLRQYLANKLLGALERRPGLRKHLQELTYKFADKLADDGQANREAHLRTANEGLKAHLSREASRAISLKDAPGPADQQHIGDLIQWWMEHDPLDASRSIVDAVGLGGAYRLPKADRLRLARAFLAMLDIDSFFEGDQTAVREPAPPPPGRSTNRDQTSRAP